MNKFSFLIFLPVILAFNCNLLKNNEATSDCITLEKIINHSEVIRILLLDKGRSPRTQVRVFLLNPNMGSCNGFVLDWPYQTYDKMRPSINTGFNRDVFLRLKKIKHSVIYEVYLASHENSVNRQTTYILKFIREKSGLKDEVRLIGFSEYTDFGEF